MVETVERKQKPGTLTREIADVSGPQEKGNKEVRGLTVWANQDKLITDFLVVSIFLLGVK